MTAATSTRDDGGFFVRGLTINKSKGGDEAGQVVAVFAGTFVDRHPLAIYQVANLLNREGGYPEIAPSKKAADTPRVAL